MPALNAPFQQVPIKQHVGIDRTIMAQRRRAGSFADAPAVKKESHRYRLRPRPDHGQLGLAGKLLQDALKKEDAINWRAEIPHILTEHLVKLWQ